MESNQASLAVIGIDIGKEVFHIVGLGVDGKIAFRRKIRRLGLKDAFEKLPPCIVGMEACGRDHLSEVPVPSGRHPGSRSLGRGHTKPQMEPDASVNSRQCRSPPIGLLALGRPRPRAGSEPFAHQRAP